MSIRLPSGPAKKNKFQTLPPARHTLKTTMSSWRRLRLALKMAKWHRRRTSTELALALASSTCCVAAGGFYQSGFTSASMHTISGFRRRSNDRNGRIQHVPRDYIENSKSPCRRWTCRRRSWRRSRTARKSSMAPGRSRIIIDPTSPSTPTGRWCHSKKLCDIQRRQVLSSAPKRTPILRRQVSV